MPITRTENATRLLKGYPVGDRNNLDTRVYTPSITPRTHIAIKGGQVVISPFWNYKRRYAN